MNLPRSSRKNRQLSIEDSPYQHINESDHNHQASTYNNTVFSTKRTSVANAGSTSAKGSNQILFSSPNDDSEMSKQQTNHGVYHQQLSHRNSNLKVPPFQGVKSGVIHSTGTHNSALKSSTQNHNNLPNYQLQTPRNILPSVAPFLRKINGAEKSPNSPDKLKTDRSSASGDILVTDRSSQPGRNVEYFALVDSICRNHALLLHSTPNIEDYSQNLSTNERTNITEINTKQISKDTSRISLKQLTKGQQFRQSLRSLKDLSEDYIKTKLKIIQDRKWLSKNKKNFTEENIDQHSERDHIFQQPSNLSLKLLPKEETFFKYPKQQDKDDLQRPLFGSKKLSSFYAGEAQKGSTPISQTFQSALSPSPQKLQLISPRGQIGREIYPFKKAESFFQGSSKTLQNEMISSQQVDTTWQDVSFNDKIENFNIPNSKPENALKKAQSEWKSSHNIIESQISTPKKFTIQSSTRLIQSRVSHKNPDLSVNKEELEVAMILEKTVTNLNSKNDKDQGPSKSESIKQTNIERQRKKQRESETKQIEQLEVALLSRGLIQAEEKEDDLLATRLRIHNYFRQKTVSLSEKQEAFSRLIEQFDGENNSPSQKKANQIVSILRNMKPFYLQQQQIMDTRNFQKKPKSVNDLLVSFKKQK